MPTLRNFSSPWAGKCGGEGAAIEVRADERGSVETTGRRYSARDAGRSRSKVGTKRSSTAENLPTHSAFVRFPVGTPSVSKRQI